MPKDECQEDSSGEIQKDGYRWRRCDKIKIEDALHSRSYMCTNPRCSMKIHLEKVSLFPEKLLITYVGVHTHTDLPPSYMAPEANTTYLAVSNPELEHQFPTGQQLSLLELIDFLKPTFGIFLKEPSKLEFWSHKDPANGSLMIPSLPQPSSDGGPDQASFPTNNVVQSPLHSNGFHNPQLSMQLQQENNTSSFHSIDAEHEHPVMVGGEFISEGETISNIQYIHELMLQQQQQQEGVAFYHSSVDPLHINENVQWSQPNAQVHPNAETLQSYAQNLGAATEDVNLQYQSLVDSIQYNEILQHFNIQDQMDGDIKFMQHLLAEGQNAGNHTTFIPLTYEQPSTSLVAGGGDINSGIQHIAPPPPQLPYNHQYTQVSSFMPPSHGNGLVPQQAICYPNEGEGW